MTQRGITFPKIEKIKEEEYTGFFVISPLFPGYGITIGNSLRRVLFSSLPGAAIYAIKITGISHEFSTISGVKEDVVQIILSLKQLRLKLHEGEEATLKLNVKGPKEVKAKDIEVPSSIEIKNPNLTIANLGKTGKLSIEMKVNCGLGYVPVEMREEEKKPIGTILIDANYSPVLGVNFTVEHTRVGRMTNYDKLIIDIETDGTTESEKALTESAKILVKQLNLIAGFKPKIKKLKKKEPKKVELKLPKIDTKAVKIEDARFSKRTTNALINSKIKTIGGLARISDEKLAQIKGLGEKGIKEIKDKLKI
ncbi:DNA-directed RNA polymerase subunit alpha [subsurface metagenome]